MYIHISIKVENWSYIKNRQKVITTIPKNVRQVEDSSDFWSGSNRQEKRSQSELEDLGLIVLPGHIGWMTSVERNRGRLSTS